MGNRHSTWLKKLFNPILRKFFRVEITSLTLDEEVIVTCSTNNDENHLFLNQEELKQVIEFLQSKVK